ncbi:Subtilisin-like serine protease [Grimontia indica]|uniref:Subtilisin-like serine protease n=1 Tax=Grimontia indica TaxID=1056512 RepID=R1IGS4_9GAMM|nr:MULTISPECIES: hypothetical protein [Grimontia]EOD79901.1 Subtilisin-like serine protease [Grimontia indica]
MKHLFLIPLSVSLLFGCTQGHVQNNAVGADRDEFGCIPSAGYQWCAYTNQCERPWELAEAEGFDNTPELFDGFCEQ